MKPTSKLKNVYISVVILALIIGAGSWYYLSTLMPAFELVSTESGYYRADTPIVELHLKNPGNANSGEALVSYSSDLIELTQSTLTEGVTMNELDNSLIFELSEDYFADSKSMIASLQFTTIDSGEVSVTFDEESTYLKDTEGSALEVEKYIDVEFSIGVRNASQPADITTF